MGNTTGFMDYKRLTREDRSPEERIQDWNEFHTYLDGSDLRIQAARCINCGTPFCHSGVMLNGMASGCPLHNLIPEFNECVYRDKMREAYYRLMRTNNFPEFTGRVCPAPCEGSCTVSLNKEAVTIKNIECQIIDYAFDKGWVQPEPPHERTRKKVAVVGSGPSGLAAAEELNRAGHTVTVYERSDRLGGLLMYGIPNMKLEKHLIDRRVALMRQSGIEFQVNTSVGSDISAQEIRQSSDAVVLCCGSTNPRDLNVEGRNLKGIYFAMDFLSQNTARLLNSHGSGQDYISAKDKHVVVIGGGDTGNDCVGTAIRHGAKSVVQLEIMPKPSARRDQSNPWPEYPRIFSTDYGQEEAAFCFGIDPREFCQSTTRFTGDESGHVTAIQTVKVNWEKDGNGRPAPVPVSGTDNQRPVDLVLLAMGFLGPESAICTDFGIKQDVRSNVQTEKGRYVTSVEGVFSAGDMRRGQSLVVWAINEGREAAREVDKYLMGDKAPE